MKPQFKPEEIYLDLSKLSEEQQRKVIALLPPKKRDNQYEIQKVHFILYLGKKKKWWVYGKEIKNKTELTYSQFLDMMGESKRNNVKRKFMARETIGFVACIDFDGTIAQNAFPGIGKLVKNAKDIINKMYDEGVEIIISSCRTGSFEADAENYLRRHGIKYDYLNCNLPRLIEDYKQDCRKISADVYIDDKCVAGLPSWEDIYEIVQAKIKTKSEQEFKMYKNNE